MRKEVFGRCPVCDYKTEVTRISCNNCDTRIEGHFQLCRLCLLTHEQKRFIESFIKCRGNIREMEKELGVSYPTVKNKLEDVASALGFKADSDSKDPGGRKGILDRLNKGQLSVEQALEMLKE